jgi:agmatine deiminase
MSNQRLLAEWEPQDAVMLTWPHKNTAWNFILDDVVQLYEALVTVICDYADVVIAAPADELDEIRGQLDIMQAPLEYIYLYPVPSNDTWARDHGPLTVATESGLKLLDFQFNGWGNKFSHDLDNQITRRLFEQEAFAGAALEAQDWVLEGGAIETDGRGTLLTTARCLLNPNRNPHLSKEEIEQRLRQTFGVQKINWLQHGYLAGDDTDSHIDTLARLCPDNVIVYTACDDPEDEHYQELKKMEQELQSMTDAEGKSYRLIPLPWPQATYNDDGQRLPATYANFLMINEAVLVPIYDCLSDEDALEQISLAFPGYDVIGIPCSSLIEQGGSLHCITMQLPEGVLDGFLESV